MIIMCHPEIANLCGEGKNPVSFENKTAIVTGAARGIGRSICLELARHGCKIAFNYSKSALQADQLIAGIANSGRSGVGHQGDFLPLL